MKRTAWVLLVWLATCQSEPQEQPPLTQLELLNPESCKGCHPTHYNEWSGSMHAYASKDPVFLAMNKRGQEATNGELREFCVNCHAPMAVRENAITDFAELDNLPEPLQGVTCYFCHNAQSVGDDHVNANITLANDNIMRAALDRPVEPTAHRVQRSDNHDSDKIASSIMCGTCHDILTPAGVRLERTLDEYLSSIEAHPIGFESCQDCHMRNHEDDQPVANSTGRSGEIVRARKLHEHLWAAIDVPLTPNFPNAQAMRAAIETCELPLRAQPHVAIDLTAGPRSPFKVTIEAVVGHGMPSGATPDRRMWIEVIGYDDADKEVYRQGVIEDGEVEDPPSKRHPFMLRDYLTDEHGDETHMFWEAASISDRITLPPAITADGGDHYRSRPFTPPVVKPLARIAVRWRVRPMGLDVLQDLVDSGHLSSDVSKQVPTLSVVDAEFRYRPDQGVYEMMGDNRDVDCSIYQCMLDPDAPQCRNR